MAESPTSLIDKIQDQIETLAALLEDERLKNAALQTENLGLKHDLKDCRSELEQSRREAEFLSLSHQLASSPQAIADARVLLGKIIRKIDSAIDAIRIDPSDL